MEAAQTEMRRPPSISPEISSNVFAELCKAFECARNACPDEYAELSFCLAGKVVQVRVVGRALAAIYQRAFAPRALPTPPNFPPALTIDLWDEEVTAIPYPKSANRDSHLCSTDFEVQYDESGRWAWNAKGDAATWLDRKANRFVGWRASSAKVSIHERSKPLSILLPLWFYDQGIHIVHAGVVARQGHGALITGGSGIGKTTTTLCCLLAGLDYLGDDHVAVTQAENGTGEFVAHSVFQSARVLPDHLQRFPNLPTHAIYSHDPLDPKTLLFLSELFPDRVVGEATIRVVALPRLSGREETTFQRATRANAINYMAPTSLFTSYGIGRARSIHLLQLIGSVPCYWLDLGTDLAKIPPVIEQLLEVASTGARAT
jgi:hypothetical protein